MKGTLQTHLREDKIDDDELDNDPADVEEVKFPRHGGDAQRVDVGVEGAADARDEGEHGHALGADGVGQDLDDLGVCQRLGLFVSTKER